MRAGRLLNNLWRLLVAAALISVALSGAVLLPAPVVNAAPQLQSGEWFPVSVEFIGGGACSPVDLIETIGAPDEVVGGMNVPAFGEEGAPCYAVYYYSGDVELAELNPISRYDCSRLVSGPWQSIEVWNVTDGEWEMAGLGDNCVEGVGGFPLTNPALDLGGDLYNALRFNCSADAEDEDPLYQECRVDTFGFVGELDEYTPTPTATPNAATQTAQAATQTAGATQTAIAGATQTSAALTTTPTPGPTNTVIPRTSRNRLINTDFNVAPKAPGYGWTDINRVVQAPVLALLSDPIEHMEKGSCGPKYWVMSTPNGAGEGGNIWQNFSWEGGQMFINLEALTNSYTTRGQVTITDLQTGAEEPMPYFSNGSFSWQSFTWVTQPKAAGEYRFSVDFIGVPGPDGSDPGIAIDNVNLRRGNWGNDCPADIYDGQLPTDDYATATSQPTITLVPNVPGQNLLNNCGFEQGWSAYSHNAGSRLFSTGGATGPTYAYLYTVFDNGSDPIPADIPGRIWQPFNWRGGGMMYVTYFTGPGTRVNTSIRNLQSGVVYPMQMAAAAQSSSNWLKRSYAFNVPVPGQYIIEASAPAGQIAALDGFTVAAGTFASGPCANANTPSDNNATATAHATQTQIAGTAGPDLTATADANNGPLPPPYLTYVASGRHTATAIAAASQTAAPLATQTRAAANTQTQSARLTATAQGTPVPTFTRTPVATTCLIDPTTGLCWIVAPPVTVVVSDAELTAIAAEMNATLTQRAIEQETFWAQVNATVTARAQATARMSLTQTQAPVATASAAAQQTNVAAAAQTAAAAATQTAIAGGINAQATANALATQQAQQAAATQTAAAQQTVYAGADPATQAAATATAAAHATQYAGVTATANALRTADAINTANAQATARAQQTANSAATAVALATQLVQNQQATQTAAAVQTSLAGDPQPTAEAQATTTAAAVATSAAQATATAIYVATVGAVQTQIVSGTTVPGGEGELPPVPERPEPQPGVDCQRPTSPLQVANWIDYEVCRVLAWLSWAPQNTEQVMQLELLCAERYPCGLILELQETFDVWVAWAQSIPCVGGFCDGQALTQFNISARGILMGEFEFGDGPTYGTECDLLMAPITGPALQRGACFCLNVLCALGILPWMQLIWNFVMAYLLALYVQRTWFTSAHT